MAQSATRPEARPDPWGDWIIPTGAYVCLLVLLFASIVSLRSPEAEGLEAALDWADWYVVIGSLGCGLVWLVLQFRKPPCPTALDGALERITKPPEADPVGAEHYWLAAAYNVVVFPGALALRAPATLEALIRVDGPRGLISGTAWLGVFVFGGLMIILSIRRAMRAGRAPPA